MSTKIKRQAGNLPDKGDRSFGSHYFTGVIHALHHPHVNAGVLFFAIDAAIPAPAVNGGAEHELSPAVVDTEILHRGQAHSNGADYIIIAITIRRKAGGHKYLGVRFK